jgi:predicted Zn-dependent peptidase
VEENWGDDTILMVTGDIDDTKVVTNTDNYFGDWTD